MSTLVIAEHDNGSLKGATLNTVAAAQALGADIDILVAGAGCGGAAQAAAAIPGIGKVLVAEDGEHAVELALKHEPDLIISDLRLPGAPGTDLISRAGDVPVLIMTSYASLRSAVDSMPR